MRALVLVLIFIGVSSGFGESSADPLPNDGPPHYSAETERYRHEQYQTEIMRERAERAYLDHQIEMYEYQRREYQRALDRSEQDRDYNHRYNSINSVNQAANVAGNIGWQIRILSRELGR